MARPSYHPNGGLNTDHSANAPAVGTLGTLLCTFPVNDNRVAHLVQNQSNAVAYVVLDDGAGNNVSVIILAAGTSGQGGSWDNTTGLHTGRIRVYGTAGGQIGAYEI